MEPAVGDAYKVADSLSGALGAPSRPFFFRAVGSGKQNDGMDHLDRGRPGVAKPVLDLEMTAGIGGGDDRCLGGEEVPHFSFLEPPRRLGLRDVIDAGAATAPFGFAALVEFQSGDRLKDLARLGGDLLPGTPTINQERTRIELLHCDGTGFWGWRSRTTRIDSTRESRGDRGNVLIDDRASCNAPLQWHPRAVELGFDLIAILVAAAFIAGMIDAIAGGGGLITIPALLAAGIPPVAALATNKLQSTFGTGGAVVAFALKGRIDFKQFALPAFAAFAGSGLGALILTIVDATFLSAPLPFLLIAMAVYFVVAPRMGDVDKHSRFGAPTLIAVALIIGCYDGFFGPGTGSFFTTALVAVFGFGLVRSVANTKLLNLASNLAALGVLVVGGHVLWGVGLAMAAASIVGGQAGAYAAIKFGAGAARPLLIIMSLALTAKLLADPANPLRALLFSWAL